MVLGQSSDRINFRTRVVLEVLGVRFFCVHFQNKGRPRGIIKFRKMGQYRSGFLWVKFRMKIRTGVGVRDCVGFRC